MEGRYLGAEEAARELGVSVATLYSYVSRGLVRSEPGGGRRRRYRAEDVGRLRERAERRKNPDGIAEGALDYGVPVMESSISLIEDGGLFYRGHDAVLLSRKKSIEEVASLLWTGEMDLAPGLFGAGPPEKEFVAGIPDRVGGLSPVDAFQVALTVAASRDAGAYDFAPRSVALRGAAIMSLAVWLTSGGSGSISGALGEGWGVAGGSRDLLDAALVLCADHELPVSTFAARCVASSRATPYAVVQAGLAALGGTRHGGFVKLVGAFVREAEMLGDAGKAVCQRLRRGEKLPGFGPHPLYPGGDPRGEELLRRIEESLPDSPEVKLAGEITGAVREVVGGMPTVDFGLVTLERALGLPEDSALTTFSIGRTAGWIGHAIEQYRDDSLIRPRTRYTGRVPERGEWKQGSGR